MKFLKPNDPLLTKVSKKVPESKINSPEIKKIADLMIKIIQGEQKSKKKGVGLAAPQIGILKRIILVDLEGDQKKKGDLRIYINPEITWVSKRKGGWYEGCFSTGKVCGIVSRPASIKIKAFTLKTLGVRSILPPRWDFVEEKHTGYIARIFQHEIDHLNGTRFPDRITDADNLHFVLAKEFKKYRKSFKTWPKKCSFKKWQQICDASI